RSCVIALAEGRQRLDHLTGPRSSWQGRHAAEVVRALTEFSWRLRLLEDSVAEFTQAWQDWRAGVAGRQDRTAELVDLVSRLDPDEPGRSSVVEQAEALGDEHRRDADRAAAAADALVAAIPADEDDLAADLGRGLGALLAAVEEWITDAGGQLERTAESVEEISELTEGALGVIGVDGETLRTSARVRQMVISAPSSHRLHEVLQAPKAVVDPGQLDEAT